MRSAFVLLVLQHVNFVLALAASASATDASFFVTPIININIAGPRSRSERSTLMPALDMAAKKKKKKKSNNHKRTKASSSGNGFGRTESQAVADHDAPPSPARSIHPHLLSWLEENPNTYISPKFSIRHSALGGYGGFANVPVERDELLFRIPRECCVTHDDALHDPDIGCGTLFRSIRERKLPSWGMILIAGKIAKEILLCMEYAAVGMFDATQARLFKHEGYYPKHKYYLYTLPWGRGELDQDHVLFWSDEEVDTLLRGSLAYDDALLIRNTVDDAVKILSDTLVQNIVDIRTKLRIGEEEEEEPSQPGDRRSDDEAEIREELRRTIRAAFVIALSRSFAEEVESDDGTIEVENLLLPLIDILQHSNTPNTILEPYEDYIMVRAGRDVDADEELFHRYQEEDDDVIPPHKFFTRYGFVPGAKEPVADLLKGRSSLFFGHN